MLRIPSPTLDKRGPVKFMNWDWKKKKKRHPMYPVQYLHNKTTIGVPGPGPTIKLVRIMVQDSVQKKKKKKKQKGKKSNVPKGNKQNMLLRKILEAVLKHKYRSMQKKKGVVFKQKKK